MSGVGRERSCSNQRDVFLESEGDAYEDRNAQADADMSVLNYLVPHVQPGWHVLEIGCGAGQNLAALERLVPGISCFGIDPSSKAIKRGRLRAPHHRLEVGTADSIPFEGPFDLVFFGFCLYLCDRSLLHAAVWSADRVLRGGDQEQTGLLAILDFDPGQPHQHHYAHDPRLSSYKMDYSALFLADPAYRLVAKFAFDQARRNVGWARDPHNRVALWILEKNVPAAYPEQP